MVADKKTTLLPPSVYRLGYLRQAISFEWTPDGQFSKLRYRQLTFGELEGIKIHYKEQLARLKGLIDEQTWFVITEFSNTNTRFILNQSDVRDEDKQAYLRVQLMDKKTQKEFAMREFTLEQTM